MPDMLQEQRQQDVFQQPQQVQQEDLQQHLIQLNHWDLQGQSIEQRRAQEKDLFVQNYKEDVAWLKMFYQNIARAEASVTAKGQPKQEHTPQKLSWWEKRRIEAKRKAAKRIHPDANEKTYDMAAALTRRREGYMNSLETVGGEEKLRDRGYDDRILLDWCQGYQKDANGKPATEDDARKMREDKQFLEDYDSRDAQRRKPHLDRMVDELLKIQITESMFEQPYVTEHIAELRSMSQKLLLIQNIRDDNPDYFERLKANAPLKYARLEAQNHMGRGVNVKLDAVLHECCINVQNSTYMEKDQEFPSDYRETDSGSGAILRESYQKKEEVVREAVQSGIDRRIEQRRLEIARQRDEILAAGGETAEKIRKSGLTADNKPDSAGAILEYQNMILSHRENYEANRNVVDRVYTELFRAIDTRDDLNMQVRCTQEYRESFDVGDPEYAVVDQHATAREAELKNILFNIGVQIECLKNLFKHLLRGDQLEASGTVAAKRFGYHLPNQERPYTLQDQFQPKDAEEKNIEFRSTMVDKQGQEHITFYTSEDQNITLASASVKKETVHYTESTMQDGQKVTEEESAEVEIAQTSAQYSYAYKTQASAIGRLLWTGHPPHEEKLLAAHTNLAALGSRMYEPIEITGKDKQARLKCAKKQIEVLQDEIAGAMDSCYEYVNQKFGLGKKKKAAKVLVEETLKILQADFQKLEDEKAQLQYRLIVEDMTFGDLLGETRATVIDLNREKNTDHTGANMSDVLTVGEGEGKLFFKEEEYVRPFVDVFKQKFMSTPKDREKYGALLPLLEDADRAFHREATENKELGRFAGFMWTAIGGYADAVNKEQVNVMDQTIKSSFFSTQKEVTALNRIGLTRDDLLSLVREISTEMKKPMLSYLTLNIGANIAVGRKIALRNVATSRMASMLGVGQVVVKSTTAIVQEKGKQQRRGIVMARAHGQPAAELETKHNKIEAEAKDQKKQAEAAAKKTYEEASRTPGTDLDKAKQEYQRAKDEAERIYRETMSNQGVKYTPDAVRQLVNLNLLDLICGQIDRHMNNYFVTTNQEGRIDGVQGIDNDLSFGRLQGSEIVKEKHGSSLLGINSMRLPVVDQDMYESICTMSDAVIRVNFADLLTEEEVNALVSRFQTVRDYLVSRVEKQELSLVKKGEWTDAHLAQFKNGYEGYVRTMYI